MHGYSEGNEIDNEDQIEETILLNDGLQERRNVSKIKSEDLCLRVDNLVKSRSELTKTCKKTKKGDVEQIA